MLKSLDITNFTAFQKARLKFAGPGLNVIVGENGTGKTHLLKLPYAVMALASDKSRRRDGRTPTKAFLQTGIAEKLANVFRPEDSHLGRLAHRQQGRTRCAVSVRFNEPTPFGFNFASQNKFEVVVDRRPTKWLGITPVYLPPHELLTIYPGFVSLYEESNVEFEETLYDTCLLLGKPTAKGPRDKAFAGVLELLEKQIGNVVRERNDRFYLRQTQTGAANIEMHLVAEGWRKLAMLYQLVATRSIVQNGTLFWDEPEANLNPKLIKAVAEAILHICSVGVQVIVATHSLFLLREFEILLNSKKFQKVKQRCFALKRDDPGVQVSQYDKVADADPLAMLDEELGQSDRYLKEFMS